MVGEEADNPHWASHTVQALMALAASDVAGWHDSMPLSSLFMPRYVPLSLSLLRGAVSLLGHILTEIA